MLLVQQAEHPVVISEVEVLEAPRIAAPVGRIRSSCEADLVSVIDTRHARKSVLQCREQLDLAGRRIIVLFGRHRRDYPFAVVRANEVQCAVEVLRRVILFEGEYLPSRIARADRVIHIVEKDVSQRVVHRAVELAAEKISAPLAVAYLVACVLPDLSYEKALRVRLFDGPSDALDE